MADITNRVVLLFRHPKHSEEKPIMMGFTIPWIIVNGPPCTEKGKPWVFVSTEIMQ